MILLEGWELVFGKTGKARAGMDGVPVRGARTHVDESLLVHGGLDGGVGVRGCSAEDGDGEDEDDDVDERGVAQSTRPKVRGSGHGESCCLRLFCGNTVWSESW